MGDVKEDLIKATVAGREVTLRRPTEDQIVAWMGLVGSLVDEDSQDNPDADKEVVGDVTLFLDAMLASFVDDKDRRMFRRDIVMGNATISELFQALLPGESQNGSKPKKSTGVRRA